MLASTRSKIQIGIIGLFVIGLFANNVSANDSAIQDVNGKWDLLENFDNDTTLDTLPTGVWYTATGSNTLIKNDIGSNAWWTSAAQSSGSMHMFASNYSLCDTGVIVDLTIRIDEFDVSTSGGVGSIGIVFGLSDVGTGSVNFGQAGVGFSVGPAETLGFVAMPTGNLDNASTYDIKAFTSREAGANNNGVSFGGTLVTGLAVDTNQTIRMRDINCSAKTYSLQHLATSSSISASSSHSVTYDSLNYIIGAGGAKLAGTTTGVADAGSSDEYLVDVSVQNAIKTALFTAASTVTATDLRSFDLSPSDTFVSANTNGGEFIRTYTLGGVTGEQLGAFETDCLQVIHGHVALTNQVIFFDCDSGTNEVESLKVYTKQMTVPDVNVYCPNCVDAETTTVDIDNISGDDENTFEDIHAITYASQVEAGFLSWQVLVQDDEGRVNTLTLFQRTGCSSGQCNEPTQNNVNRDLFQYGGTTTAFAICTQPSGTGTLSSDEALGYAVDSSFAGAGFTLTKEVGISGFGSSVMWTIDETFAGPSGFNFAQDVDCADALPRLIVGKSTTVSLINTDTAGTLCTTTATTVSDVTISKDGLWYAYADSGADRAYIYNATSCEQVAQIDLPSGTFKEIELDSFGQNIYAATSTTIARYEIYTATTIEPVGGGTTPPGTPPTPPTSPGGFTGTPGSNGTCFGCTGRNVFGINIDQTADGLNIPVKSVQALIGLILMVVFAIWLYRGTESVLMAMVGALAGLVVAALIGLVAMWIVMLIVLALLIIFGKMVFGAASEEA